MKLAILVMFAIVVKVVVHTSPITTMASRAGGGARRFDEKPRTFCGRQLANARFLYCFGAPASMRKRAIYDPEELALMQSQTSTVPGMLKSLQDGAERRRPGTSQVKRTGGIADECCLKPCYISDLLNYC